MLSSILLIVIPVEWHSAKWHSLPSVILLSGILLSVILLSGILLSVILLSGNLPSVLMVSGILC